LQGSGIIFDEDSVETVDVDGVRSIVCEGLLSPDIPDKCPCCGKMKEGSSIVRHGTKASNIVIPGVSGMTAYLKLNKQRYLCRNCGHTFSAKTDIVQKNCFISENTRLMITLEAKKKKSQKDIASELNVSQSTVCNLLMSLYDDFIVQKNYLPKHLCFDEFKSVKKTKGKMSFLVIDAETGDIINVLEDRRYNELIRYFLTYTRAARYAVKTVCMDMYTPYKQLVKALFPNAKIILDRFHIIQMINNALNRTRTDVMKHSKEDYTKFKKYWKLILKNEEELDDSTFVYSRCFRKPMRECDIVEYLLSKDDELRSTYDLYQSLLRAVRNREPDRFFKYCDRYYNSVSGYMKKTLRSFYENREGITNALTNEWSNGVIEGTNNLIKTIKRIAFGYRSFVSFKVRILLIGNTMVRFTNRKKGIPKNASCNA
jgi:transposase